MAKNPVPGPLNASKQYDFHLNLDFNQHNSEAEDDFDFSNFSDSDADFESDVTLEELAGSNIKLPDINGFEKVPKTKGSDAGSSNGDSMALVPAAGVGTDPYQVDSDEEKDLLRGIKDEITEMVRGEMQSELAFYQHKIQAIEAGCLPSRSGQTPQAVAGKAEEKDKYPDLADMEPELREAYIKMRKLDRILEKKMKKEKEVKRDRILLERRIREEIASLNSNGRVQRDIQTNTDKYLSLALPPSHNEGVFVDEPPVTPLFQTQVDENDLQQHQKPPSNACTTEEDQQSAVGSSRSDGTASTMIGSTISGQHRRRKKKKDFIKRNKELAANANDTVAMTDDEKKRLQELLADVDMLPEIPEEESSISGDDNPYQIVVHPGEGFHPSENELRTLNTIDQRLQFIMPEDEFRSITSSVLSHTTQQRLFTRVGARAEVDFELCGEKVLLETKEDREFRANLKRIEDQLAAFHNTDSASQSETPALSEQELDRLLDDCVHSLSRVSLAADNPESVSSDRSLESAKANLMLHPPKLSEETLQKLLSEAHFPLSTRLLDLQDDDSKSANGDMGKAVIRAETWKAIAETTLSGDEDEGNSMESTPRANTTTTAPSGIHHNTPIRQSSAAPYPSLSDPSVSQQQLRSGSIRPAFTRYSSDSDGQESHVSLPEIRSSPLINTPQGNKTNPTTGMPNNLAHSNRDGASARSGSSLENRVHNDLSWSYNDAASPGCASSGTSLMVKDIGQVQSTPSTPQPPSLSERRSAPRVNRRSSEVKEAGH